MAALVAIGIIGILTLAVFMFAGGILGPIGGLLVAAIVFANYKKM